MASRIAVVDDDAGVRRSIGRLLRAAGFDVSTFDSAEAFLSDVPPWACLVLDVQLPGLSGRDLAGMLAGTAPAPPIVLMTSHEPVPGDAGVPERWTCLRKPFDAADLIAAIQRLAPADAP